MGHGRGRGCLLCQAGPGEALLGCGPVLGVGPLTGSPRPSPCRRPSGAGPPQRRAQRGPPPLPTRLGGAAPAVPAAADPVTVRAAPSLRIGTGLGRRAATPTCPGGPPEAPAQGTTPATRTSCHPAASKRVSIRGFNPKEVSRPGSATPATTSEGRTRTWGQPFPCHPCP